MRVAVEHPGPCSTIRHAGTRPIRSFAARAPTPSPPCSRWSPTLAAFRAGRSGGVSADFGSNFQFYPQQFFTLDRRCPILRVRIPRMKMKFFPPYKDEGEVVASWGQAQLIRFLDGKTELRGGSDQDRAEAREWLSVFWHEAVVRDASGPRL